MPAAKPVSGPPIAIGPDHGRLRGWRVWGDKPMPILRSRKRRAPEWLFIPAGPRAKIGRPPGDPDAERGCSVGKDNLLERLCEVHSDP